MSRPSRRLLCQWLSGGLDPARAARVEEEVAADPQLQAEVALILRETEEAAPRVWTLPPPGRAVGLEASVRAAGLLGSPHAPALLRVHLRAEAETPRQVIVLHQRDGLWQVVWPETPEDLQPLDELPRGAEGERVLELGAPPAEVRVAVVLAPLDLPIAWEDAEGRWEALRALLERGAPAVLTLPRGGDGEAA